MGQTASAADWQSNCTGAEDQANLEAAQAMYRRYRLAFTGAEEVLPQDIKKAHEARHPLILVDCRTPEEQAVSTLPHAVSEAQFRSALPPPRSAGVLGFGAEPAADADILRAVQPLLVPSTAQLFDASTSGASVAAGAPSSDSAQPAATGAADAAAGGGVEEDETHDDEAECGSDERPLVVLYCTIGARSGLACGGLSATVPPLRVVNLAGSLITWTHSGGRLVKKGETASKLHVYGKKWALQPEHLSAEW